jgi:hypothetical protein
MYGYLAELMDVLWANMLYRAMLITIAVEIGLIGALIIWLWGQSARQLAESRARQRFIEQLEEPFFAALGDRQALEEWMERAQNHRREFVGDLIADVLLQTRGDSHDMLVQLYRSWGFAADDRQQASSMSERKRLEALRRMYLTATEEDRAVLLEYADQDYLSRILVAQTLARVGQPEDIVEVLRGLELTNQMMEGPVRAVLEELSGQTLRYVFARWRQFESPRLRRVLLTTAATEGLEEANAALESAAHSEQLEVRIGACTAAASVGGEDAIRLLIDALDDPAWQVRARAAKGLGKRSALAAVEPLAEALKDRAFWVRQDAAAALRQIGPRGIDRLETFARHSDDRYAAEAASQELHRYRLFSNQRGTPA